MSVMGLITITDTLTVKSDEQHKILKKEELRHKGLDHEFHPSSDGANTTTK